MRRFFFSVITLSTFVLCTFVLSSLAAPHRYTDIPEGNRFDTATQFFLEKGVLSKEKKTFDADRPINRAEAVKVLLIALDIALPKNASENPVDLAYTDMNDPQWFVPYVREATKQSIIRGYKDKNKLVFGPGRTINRAEALKIMATAQKITREKTDFSAVDIEKTDWFAPHFAAAFEQNVIIPGDDNKYFPAKDVTRGEFIEFLYRFMKSTPEQPFDLATTWSEQLFENIDIRAKAPKGWDPVVLKETVVFWKKDIQYKPHIFFKLFPNTARVIAYKKPNVEKKSQKDYFAEIKNAFPEAKSTEDGATLWVKQTRSLDRYTFVNENNVLAVHFEFGDGALAARNQKIGEFILNSITPAGDKWKEIFKAEQTIEELLAEIRENIGNDGKGKALINKLDDAIITETDAIGVGTGPVDYYYSQSLGFTLKYERSFDVILSIKEGKTAAF